jgi:hypothetical protein
MSYYHPVSWNYVWANAFVDLLDEQSRSNKEGQGQLRVASG